MLALYRPNLSGLVLWKSADGNSLMRQNGHFNMVEDEARITGSCALEARKPHGDFQENRRLVKPFLGRPCNAQL